jgi:hypothetical protein
MKYKVTFEILQERVYYVEAKEEQHAINKAMKLDREDSILLTELDCVSYNNYKATLIEVTK